MYVYLYVIDVYPLHYIHKTRRVDLGVEGQERLSTSYHHASSTMLHQKQTAMSAHCTFFGSKSFASVSTGGT
jgi:hypothetical protein